MKRIAYLTVFLAVVAGLAGGVLSFVNDATLAKREEAAIAEEKVNLEKIFPGATFVAVDESKINDDSGKILGIFEAENQGVVYKLTTSGYGGEIIFVVGIDKDDKLAGVEIISHSESPGIGDVITKDDYREVVVGKASNDELSTLSGATVSTTAMNEAIKIATDHYNAQAGIDSEGGAAAEKPEIKLGDKIKLNDDKLDKYAAVIDEQDEVDGATTYTVTAEGYAVHDDEHNPNGKPNVFKISVKDNEIVQIEIVEVNDTKGIGTNITEDKYLETLIGLDITNLEQEVDVVSGATKSSYSILNAIKTIAKGQ